MGGPSLHPPKSSFLGGQQACEPVKLQLLCGNGVRALWESMDPLCVHKYLCLTWYTCLLGRLGTLFFLVGLIHLSWLAWFTCSIGWLDTLVFLVGLINLYFLVGLIHISSWFGLLHLSSWLAWYTCPLGWFDTFPHGEVSNLAFKMQA